MENQVEKGKMQISETNKGFTLIEILIVLVIISIASTSFYLLYRQDLPNEDLKFKIDQYKEMSLYTGSTYGFSKNSINTYIEGEWIVLEDFDSSYVDKYEIINGDLREVKKDQIYLILAPGHEISVKKLQLTNGQSIEIQ